VGRMRHARSFEAKDTRQFWRTFLCPDGQGMHLAVATAFGEHSDGYEHGERIAHPARFALIGDSLQTLKQVGQIDRERTVLPSRSDGKCDRIHLEHLVASDLWLTRKSYQQGVLLSHPSTHDFALALP